MDTETRLKGFMKMGFHEEDLKKRLDVKRKIYPITLSCGQCREAILADDCKIVESDITNSNFFKQRIQLLCPKCNTLVTGADV